MVVHVDCFIQYSDSGFTGKKQAVGQEFDTQVCLLSFKARTLLWPSWICQRGSISTSSTWTDNGRMIQQRSAFISTFEKLQLINSSQCLSPAPWRWGLYIPEQTVTIHCRYWQNCCCSVFYWWRWCSTCRSEDTCCLNYRPSLLATAPPA